MHTRDYGLLLKNNMFDKKMSRTAIRKAFNLKCFLCICLEPLKWFDPVQFWTDTWTFRADNNPDIKVHEDNMGPIWGWQDPGGPHVGPMDFAIW